MTNHGSQHMSQRMYRFVANFLQNATTTATTATRGTLLPSNLKIGIYDDSVIQSCDYTEVLDGRHYLPLNLVRIRLLANILDYASKMTQTEFHEQMIEYATSRFK